MRRLSAHGLSCGVPTGWHARNEQREQSTVPAPASDLPMGGYVHPVLHAATSPLPTIRGDYGSGYVETMRPTDVFVCLGEFDHEAGAEAMFDEGMPAALRAAVDALSIVVLEDHVQGCVRTAAERGEADQYVDEVIDVVRRTLGRPVRGPARSS